MTKQLRDAAKQAPESKRRADAMSEAVAQSKPNGIPTPAELGFDPAALRQKYAEERAKRLRADGNNQYREITGQYAHYNVDPYVEPGFTRPALQEELDVVIIGGGFGGMLAAVRLQEVGITNFRIIEKAGDFGGTWYWNRYPGAQCDVEGYLYLPLLEELGYIPKEQYSFAPEIFAHAQRIGKHFTLYERACFQTKVTEWGLRRPASRRTSPTCLIIRPGMLPSSSRRSIVAKRNQSSRPPRLKRSG
jgi:hypothetical protein